MEFGASVSAWRMPNEKRTKIIVSLHKGNQPQETAQGILCLEDLKPGFLISPFHNNKSGILYFPASILFEINDRDYDIKKIESIEFERRFLEIMDHFLEKPHQKPNYYENPNFDSPDQNQEVRFKSIVSDAIDKIREGVFEKVVVARTHTVEFKELFDPVDRFLALTELYPDGFVSLISIKDVGSWMGATFESLVQINPRKIFKTVSMAGTKPFDTNTKISDTTWREKEIEEQALVTRYIINQFKKIRVREFEERGPYTIRAGNVVHLATLFTVDTESISFPNFSSTMLDLLHPTSAVCGMPKDAAFDFIKRNEFFDRGLYSGFLGPANIENSTNLYVNLRCMQIFKKRAILYAGAGITHGSDPELEWQETNFKLYTLLNTIDSSIIGRHNL